MTETTPTPLPQLELAQQLWEIESIKQLKARYFRLMDTKRWDEWRDCFTEDCHFEYGPGAENQVTGRAEFVPYVRRVLHDGVTTHHGHMPEIRLTSPTTATGVWSMFDYVQSDFEDGSLHIKGYGFYEETYAKGDDGVWRIKSLRLTRLRVDALSSDDAQPVGGDPTPSR
jgi:SnoaL-like protein